MNIKSYRNVFLYWVGNEYKLISILRNLIYLHSNNGIGYNVFFINQNNVHEYVKDLPKCFDKLCPAHQADYVRVNVIHDYDGIWLDSDTIVTESLDSLFDILAKKEGFIIKQTKYELCNGIFGSNRSTKFMKMWKDKMLKVLEVKGESISWTEIGNNIINEIYNNDKSLLSEYVLFEGFDCIYPVFWDKCVEEFINKPYDNYKSIVREYQPLVVLVNSVYKTLEDFTIAQILNAKMPLNYFINKSFQNMKLIDYDFIEIGTSNFDTLIDNADDDTIGISIDAVKYYIDCLPDKPKCKKLNIGISDVNTELDVYYIPEDIINKNNLPSWFKGCNCLNKYHPLHIKHNVTHLCKIEKVKVITASELFYSNRVRNVKYLKIDTEGHDCIILKSLFGYIKSLPTIFYPNKILFESNENSNQIDVDKVVRSYISIGYKLIRRGYNTLIEYEN